MRLLILISCLFLCISVPTAVQAATIFATPNPGTVGTPVQMKVVSSCGVGCPPMLLSFGDGQSAEITGTGNCSDVYITTHTYNVPSSGFLISASRASGGNCKASDNGTLNVRIADSAPLFDINRLELTFPANGRGEITVKRNQSGLTARADLLYSGNGILNGYWEVDGNLLARVNQHVLAGGRITIETPAIPPLPTFTEGSHVIRFIVESTNSLQAIPALVYYVTSEESEELRNTFRLITPLDNAIISFEKLGFEWEAVPNVSVYNVVFLADPDSLQVFSAFTKVPRYAIPTGVLGYFSAGYSYRWQVRALDGDGKSVAKSPESRLTIERRKQK